MRYTVAIKGVVMIDGDGSAEAVEVWTDGETVSFTYQDTTIAIPIGPMNKLIKAVKREKHIK